MSVTKWTRRMIAVTVAVVGVGALSVTDPGPVPQPTVSAQTSTLGSGGEFHALAPDRVFDTRLPQFGAAKRETTPSGSDFPVQLSGLAGLPSDPSKILAVVANVTVAEPTHEGWLAVRPTGATRKPVDQMSSLVNFAAGRNVPNLVVVGIGPDGSMTVTLRTSPTGRAHVIVDVLGWISTTTANQPGARLVPVGPARLLDTRTLEGQWGWSPLPARTSRAIRIRGAQTYQPTLTIPNDPTISAALINITAINDRPARASTFLAASNAPLTPPVKTSNVNVVAGQIKAGLAVVPIDSAGNIHMYNHDGQIDVVVDIVGYFQPNPNAASTTGRIVPLDAPFRALDTRAPAFGNVPLGMGSNEDWSFKGFVESVTMAGSGPIGPQAAFLGNLTATDVRRIYGSIPIYSTYLTAYPGAASRPVSSNLNLSEGEVVPNMSLIRYGAAAGDLNRVKLYNHNGTVHYVLDVFAVVLS